MKTLCRLRLAVSTSLFCAVGFLSHASAQDVPFTPEPRYVSGEVLIQFKNGTTAAQQQNARARANAAPRERIRAAATGQGLLERAALRSGQPVEAAIRALEADPAVLFAEPNWIYVHHASSNDPSYTSGSLWGMYGDQTSPTNQFGSQAGEVWASGKIGSKNIVIGVIDEGIDVNHPDLQDNIWVNPGEIAGNGVDDDKNGYVDDIHGWDFVNNDNTVYDGGTGDKHGTHVAGTIGATGGNATGVVGVNWHVSIISAKFLGASGGTTANAIKAVDYISDLKTRHNLNLPATNNSWGGAGYSQALYDAIQRANTKDILFVAAAGNGGSDSVGDDNDITPHYPSSYTNANLISVASITSSGAKSGFSNYGATSVDLGAPGSSIYSTLPNNTYGSYSGTSMATPHVTGAVALYASVVGGNAAAMRSAILSKTIFTASLSGKCVTGGRLDVSALLESATQTTGTLGGVVVNASTGAAVSGATISAVAEGKTYSATTSSDGKYAINDVEQGDYTVSAGAQGYADSTAQRVSVVAGATATANLALVRQTGTIIGTVSDSNGIAISNATVAADGVPPVATDQAGTYTISGVPTGSYDVTASAGGYGSATQSVTVTNNSTVAAYFTLASPVLSSAMHVSKIGWKPIKKGANHDLQITVAVADEIDRTKLSNVYVELELLLPSGSLVLFKGTTTVSGEVTFTLSKAKSGAYTATVVTLALEGYRWDATAQSNTADYTLSSTSGPQAASSASADLSSSAASATSNTVMLSFTSALKAASANDTARYAVVVNGTSISVGSAIYSAGSNSVTLTVSPGALREGDTVAVYWQQLLDTNGNALSGQTTLQAMK